MISIKNLCRIVATGAFTAAMFAIANETVKVMKRVEVNLGREADIIDLSRAVIDAIDAEYRE